MSRDTATLVFEKGKPSFWATIDSLRTQVTALEQSNADLTKERDRLWEHRESLLIEVADQIDLRDKAEVVADMAGKLYDYEQTGGPQYTEWNKHYDVLYDALTAYRGTRDE